MFGGNFQTWKLHSAQDYFMFFAYILAGVLVFWLIAKHMNKQRNHEKAVEKVSGRLKKICGKPGEVLKNATLNLPEGKMTFDVVLMDKRGVYLVRTYGWGIKIYGTPDGAMWRREDAKRKEEFENPLLELKKGSGGDHKGDGRKRSSEPEGDADGRIRGQLPDSGAVSRIWFFLHNVSGIEELV